MAQRANKSLNYILFFSMVTALVSMGAGCSSTDTAQTPTPSPTPVVETPAPTPVTANPTPAPASTPTTPAPTPAPKVTMYKDGTYSANGDYMSPGGPEQIQVQLTVANDVVTDASVTPEAQFGQSKRMQGVFVANFKPLVVGKKLATLSLGNVSGSSLTPLGFNAAVAKIQAQAKN